MGFYLNKISFKIFNCNVTDNISITGYESECVDMKTFIIFNVCVNIESITYHQKFRYSELLQLHRELKDKSDKVPPFPPKQILNFNAKILENRKKALNKYLQLVFRNYELQCFLLDWMDIPRLHPIIEDGFNSDEQKDDLQLNHAPVICFVPEMEEELLSRTSSMIVKGVIQALRNPEF